MPAIAFCVLIIGFSALLLPACGGPDPTTTRTPTLVPTVTPTATATEVPRVPTNCSCHSDACTNSHTIADPEAYADPHVDSCANSNLCADADVYSYPCADVDFYTHTHFCTDAHPDTNTRTDADAPRQLLL